MNKNINVGRIREIVAGIMLVVSLYCGVTISQTTVVMPHLGADTLYISPTGCYTILDPGGTGKYENNEDSYLWIVGEQYFYIEIDYELGHTDDRKDWVRIYYDTMDWYYAYDELGGVGQRECGMWNHRALIHFHSNAYNTFDGFVIRIVQERSVNNMQYTALSESSVRLTWDDWRTEATGWTIYYNGDDDTVYEIQTTTKQAVINGLQSVRYYRYYIVNNVVPCSHIDYGWFTPQHDSTLVIMDPGEWHNETYSPNSCYTLVGPTSDTILMDMPYRSTVYNFNDGHGVYVQGRYRTITGEVGLEHKTVWNGAWGEYNYYWSQTTERSYYQWFPEGYIGMTFSNRSRYHFDVLPENDGYITPTVSGVTTTGATISWVDTTSSTSWTFRYSVDDIQWNQLTTTTPSVTLAGLETGRQYIYSIEGNVKRNSCDVAARWGFMTAGNTDTIVMPYRGNQAVLLQPRQCYTVIDAGKNGGYFNTDYSRLVLRTANHRGFRVKGRCMMYNDMDRLRIDDGWNNRDFGGNDYNIEFSSSKDSLVIYFQSDISGTGTGFVLEVIQADDSIGGLNATNVTSTSATIGWTDNSGATSWTVHYGDSEDNFHSVNVNTTTVNLTGLTPGVQYVYYITNGGSSDGCLFSERKGFITQGVPTGEVLMPFRGIDTLIIYPNTCYKIWDAGGKNHNYFNNDTSVLVIMSYDGSDFTLDGQWLFGGNEARYASETYDGEDRMWYMPYSSETYYWDCGNGWYNRFATNDHIRLGSSNGYLRLRFTSNSRTVRPGFCFTIDRSQNEVSNVKMTRVTSTAATVTWNDNSGASQWNITYGPVGGFQYTATSMVRNFSMNNLLPNTDYEVRIYAGTTNSCEAPSTFFTTLEANAIVMTSNGDDTVYVTPGQCYYVYDPGGTGDYLPSDSSRLVIRSTTGEGFWCYGEGHVGESDYSDWLRITGIADGQYWWNFERWCWEGEITIELLTNEALQNRGLFMTIKFPSRVYNPDTLNMTDSTVTITWQDTSNATQWNFSYGTHIDSMTTVTTSTKQYTMTGLERNREYFYSIYNTTENQECVLENIYGVIMPTDAGYYIHPYMNYFLGMVGRRSLYHQGDITLTPNQCYHFLDIAGVGNLFQNSYSGFSFHTTNNQGITLEGYYDLGSSSIWISTNQYGSWYNNSGYLKIYAPDGNISFDQRTGTSLNDFAEGFDFNVSFNYKIYNVRTQNMTCTSAQLLWDDTTSATQWTLAYGPTEKMLDTLVLNSKSANLTNLLPDHQYVCYLTSNDNTLSCLKPVKYCFITTCDTTIFVIPYNRDTTRVLDINECYTIYDGGSDMDYLYNDRHNVRLWSSNGNAMTLRGNIDLGDNDYLNMWDDVTGEWLGGYGRAENVVIHVPSGRIYMDYNSAGDTVTGSGFEFHVTFHSVSNIKVSLKTDTTCRLTWDDNSGATQWVCYYGQDKVNMDSIVTTQKMAHLQNLVYGKKYYVFITNNSVACIDTTWYDFCAGGDKCVGFGDIYSCFATAYHGRFNYPEEYKELVDYGPDDINSHHTVIDDTLMTDPRTGNMLRCVPPGHFESVRLGNWDIGGEAESLVYEYDVDTTKSEILLLRYAAVLENPGHSPSMQPRFQFMIVDENNNPINTDCYSADFVSSNDLGWNVYQYDTNTVLWKDWTAIGVDLAPLHGQRIFYKLTTYDCNEMGHFGYAYFTLECEEKEMLPNECGVVHSNTFSAPEGFRYEWYNIDSANVILSTARTFTSNQNGIYKCKAHFLGSEGSNCFFEKTVVVGDIFPYANYSYEIVDTNGCNVVVQFHNLSCVSMDEAGTQQTSMECDGFVWDFGDGEVSYDKHPMHIFPSQEFNITLTASLANGTCSDDTTQTVLMRSPCIAFDTIYHQMCEGDTFALRDSVYLTTGNYTVRTEYSEDSVVTTFVFLTVHHTMDTNLLGGICDGNAYTSFGFNEVTEGDYVHAFTSIYGCDSIYRLHLVVSSSYDTLVLADGCSNNGYTYRDTTFMTSTVYVDSLYSVYMCDSVVTLNLSIHPVYDRVLYDTICKGGSYLFGGIDRVNDSVYVSNIPTWWGCDSIETLHLTVNDTFSNFHTELICNNATFTYRGVEYGAQLIVDSLQTIWGCDSVERIEVRYFDTTFKARCLLSIDSVTFTERDSSLAGCVPLTVFMVDSSVSANGRVWLFGDGNNSTLENPVHQYTDTGFYTVTLIASSGDGCYDTAKVVDAVQVLPAPEIAFEWTPERPTIFSPEADFVNLTQPSDSTVSHIWYFYRLTNNEAPLDSSLELNPHHIWPNDGDLVNDHDVTLVASRMHIAFTGDTLICFDSLTQPVTIVNIYLQYPNVVTPNGDGINDTWKVVNLIEYGLYPINRLRIFNRWGRLVYKRDNISTEADSWNPNECDCPDGTYFFRFDGQGDFGYVQHNGAIEVVRDR
ncbi:MAG: fibronectin type III domain-containing protein [Bacteroidales bacterium]|nr:fibronectin type III domain-containing protein [Bacteroidales bacterium]